ncbi:polysaccharide deacetylase family protein [Selenomonas caprae]|uniref:Polysaccharide deacetylase n=2 Tax=Selenomonas TaxID=970 RepID=A0A1I3I0A0_SELRU|nr:MULTISPECIES: polysaccharide deacetylase family protein [Selenomonas]TYZ26737.1 polysaccharide deacetylase family protein [Selenomonas caprae]SFI41445.1 Polysaccharide deacetylase [Selenomonas ruminantium]
MPLFYKQSLLKRWWKRISLLLLLLLIPLLASSPKQMTATMVADSENGTKVMVLNYHKIDNTFISLAVRPDDFEAQMKYLSENGYHTISPDELYDSLAGTGELPENPVLITFDDGYVDNYTNAYPILKKYGFKATIFVITSFLGKDKNYMTWDQARELDANGISIESHTVDHKSMTDLTDEQLRMELVESKKKAEKELGHPVEYMAYPTGTYNLHIAEMVKEAGYKAAFTIKYGNVDKASNIYALERVPIFHTEDTNKDFLERIRYTPIFERFGWIKS